MNIAPKSLQSLGACLHDECEDGVGPARLRLDTALAERRDWSYHGLESPFYLLTRTEHICNPIEYITLVAIFRR